MSAAAQPQVRSVLAAYCFGSGMELRVIPEREGRTDLDALADLLGSSVACVYLQQPNFYGCLGRLCPGGRTGARAGAKLILGCNPISLALLKSPGESGADSSGGRGPASGPALAFGGPYLGFMATTKGAHAAAAGAHRGPNDRRRRQTCLCAHPAGAGAAHPPRKGKLQHLFQPGAVRHDRGGVSCPPWAQRALPGGAALHSQRPPFGKRPWPARRYPRKHAGPYFHEFVTTCPVPAAQASRALEAQGYLGGLPVGENELLWCATELNTPEEIETLAAILKEVGKA